MENRKFCSQESPICPQHPAEEDKTPSEFYHATECSLTVKPQRTYILYIYIHIYIRLYMYIYIYIYTHIFFSCILGEKIIRTSVTYVFFNINT